MHNPKAKALLKEKYRIQKAAELHKLPTAIHKIEFWYELGLSWLEQSESYSYNEILLEPFKFQIPSEEYESVNAWIVENFCSHTWHDETAKHERYLTLDNLTADFEKRYLPKKEKKTIINELRAIDTSFESHPSLFDFSQRTSTKETSYKYHAEYKAFEDYVRYEAEPDYHNVFPQPWRVLQVRNGYILGQYYKHLQNLLHSPQLEEVDEGNMPQKLLLLHYLGWVSDLREKTPSQNKMAVLLNALIGGHTDNIESKLSALKSMNGKIASKKNLEYVAKLFDKAGLNKEAEEARKALKEIYRAELK